MTRRGGVAFCPSTVSTGINATMRLPSGDRIGGVVFLSWWMDFFKRVACGSRLGCQGRGFVELRDTGVDVTVADVDVVGGIPGDVGRSVERRVRPSLSDRLPGGLIAATIAFALIDGANALSHGRSS